MKFYFIIKSLFSISFFKTLAPHQHRALAIDHSSDIVVASISIDRLNVIYRSHILILLVCFIIYMFTYLPPYIVNHQECLKKINNDSNFLQKSSAEKNKIAAIFYVNATQVCKTQFHWSSRMEWPGINQSASTTHQPHETLYFLFYCLLQI